MVDSPTVTDSPQPGARSLSDRQSAGRNAVLAAAADAFTSRGYAATSIDDIADRLGATKGRVYHYFRTKGEVFVGIHRKALDMAIDRVEHAMEGEGPPSARFRNMVLAHANLMMEQTGYMRLAMQHAEMNLAREGRTSEEEINQIFELRTSYERIFEKAIQEGIEAGEFTVPEASLMAKAVLGSLNWITVWYRPRADGSADRRDQIAESIADFVLAGLGWQPTARTSGKPQR